MRERRALQTGREVKGMGMTIISLYTDSTERILI
jgi:hypothetical protein